MFNLKQGNNLHVKRKNLLVSYCSSVLGAQILYFLQNI